MPYVPPGFSRSTHASSPLPVSTSVGDSIGQAGSLTAGVIGATAAGTTIVSVTPGAGKWSVDATAGYGGVADAMNNLKLVVDGTDVLPQLVVPAVANTLSRTTVLLTLAGGQAISLATRVANTVAASIFLGQLVATPVSN